jgi:hypothetical protein
MAYTGVQIFADLKRLTSEYISDAINPAIGNYILKKGLFETIEENYKNLAVQKNKDELGSLIKTEKLFNIYNNGVNVGNVPISSVIVASATTYTIAFLWEHHLGASVAIAISEVLGTTNANGSYSYTAGVPTAGQYAVVDSTTITVSVVSAVGTYTEDTGIMTNANIIKDYLHLLTAKIVFNQATKYTVSGATFASPIVITINENNNLRTNEKILISGVVGNTNANATSYIKKQQLKTMALYSDEDLATAVAGNAAYTSGGIVKRVVESYCKPQDSDKKIDFYKGTVKNPLIETTQKQMMVYPKDKGAASIYMDYITTETKQLTVTSTIDYELFYNRTFLDKVVNKSARIFSVMVSSGQDFELLTAQSNQNTNALS